VEGAALPCKTEITTGTRMGCARWSEAFFFFGGSGKEWRKIVVVLRGLRIVEWATSWPLGERPAGAVLTAFKVPSLQKHLFYGFVAIGERDPGVTSP